MGRYILLHGKIFTGTAKNAFVEALVIIGKYIVYAGSEAEAKCFTDDSFETIDLHGMIALPGFVDSHIHYFDYCIGLKNLDLSDSKSELDAALKIAEAAKERPKGEWITGGGWNKSHWKEGNFPSKKILDDMVPDNPVIMYARDIHSAWVNSYALRLANVNSATEQPDGGEIVSDHYTKEPSGLLKDKAITLVRRAVPELSFEKKIHLMSDGMRALHRLGVVGVHDMDGRNMKHFIEMKRRDQLKLRTLSAIHVTNLKNARELGLASEFGDEWLKIGPLKLFADGSLGSETAHMLEPYEGSVKTGTMVTDIKEIAELAQFAVRSNISCAIHAIGDKANRDVLDVFENLYESSRKAMLKHRIEHAQILTKEDVLRFSKLNIVASMQPAQIPADIDMTEKLLSMRSRWAYPFRSLTQNGAKLVFGSDAPVEEPDPVKGIFCAVSRRRLDGTPSTGWYSEERLTVEESVRAYSIVPAMLSSDENRGSLASGKLADLVILSDDIFSIPVMNIPATTVVLTMIAGEIVYSKIH